MTPEESQKVTDFRRRILANIAANRNPNDGFTPEELSEGLAILRQGRALAGSRGGASTAKAAQAKEKETAASDRLNSKLKGFDLD